MARRRSQQAFGEREYRDIGQRVKRLVENILAAGAGVRPGFMTMYGGSTAPTGYLLCEGQTIVAADYPELAAVIGTTFGGTTNNPQLPDFRGRSPIGAGVSDSPGGTTWALGTEAGTEGVTLSVTNMPSHSHGGSSVASDGNHGHTHSANRLTDTTTGGTAARLTNLAAGATGDVSTTTTTDGSHTHTVTVATQGGGNAHANVHPVTAVNVIIKY